MAAEDVILEVGLVSELKAVGAIAAKVGDRIVPRAADQDDAAPYLTYQRISNPRESTMTEKGGFALGRIQVTAWATTYVAAKLLAQDVTHWADDHVGKKVGAVDVDSVEADEPVDGYDDIRRLYAVSVDILVWHRGV